MVINDHPTSKVNFMACLKEWRQGKPLSQRHEIITSVTLSIISRARFETKYSINISSKKVFLCWVQTRSLSNGFQIYVIGHEPHAIPHVCCRTWLGKGRAHFQLPIGHTHTLGFTRTLHPFTTWKLLRQTTTKMVVCSDTESEKQFALRPDYNRLRWIFKQGAF